MLKVHTSDGKTQTVDLADEDQARELLLHLRENEFQSTVTGMSIAHMGAQFSFPRPSGDFSQLFFNAERIAPDPERRIKGAQRILCLADNVSIGLIVHDEQRAARIAMTRMGKQRFNPVTR